MEPNTAGTPHCTSVATILYIHFSDIARMLLLLSSQSVGLWRIDQTLHVTIGIFTVTIKLGRGTADCDIGYCAAFIASASQ